MNAGNPIKPPGGDDDIEVEQSPHYDEDMNRRVTRLEVIAEVVLPTLVTKADLQADLQAVSGALRADIRDQMLGMQRWMLTIAIAQFVGLGGLMVGLASFIRH